MNTSQLQEVQIKRRLHLNFQNLKIAMSDTRASDKIETPTSIVGRPVVAKLEDWQSL